MAAPLTKVRHAMKQIESGRFSSLHILQFILMRWAAFPLLILLLAVPIKAQTFRGTVVGNVTDPQGAVVENAKVSARNVDTGIERSTVTDDSGNYAIPELPIGNYELSVEK